MPHQDVSDARSWEECQDAIQEMVVRARAILLVAQMLFGLQFLGMFLSGFDGLPESSRSVHLTSFTLTAVSILLLQTRIARRHLWYPQGNSAAVYRFVRRTVLYAVALLAAGIVGDSFVVARDAGAWGTLVLVSGLGLLGGCYGIWLRWHLFAAKSR